MLLARAAPPAQDVVIVPDRHGTGTNALLLDPSGPLRAAVRAGLARAPRRAGAATGACEHVVTTCLPSRSTSTPATTSAARPRARRRARPGTAHARGAQPDRPHQHRRGLSAPALSVHVVPGMPEVRARRRPRGADRGRGGERRRGDRRPATSLVVSQKVVSKAEGRLVALGDVEPSRARAGSSADRLGKDPRLVQVVLDESAEVLRAERGVLITRTRHGLVCANAGVDQSNVPGDDSSCLLPADPDASARDCVRANAPQRRRGRDLRQLRARVAPRPGRRRDRLRRAGAA